jgi:hypothetical protein
MSATSTTRGEPQSADAVLMIRPAHFDSNAQTATSNSFQSGSPTADDTATSAQNEFDALALALASAGVRVHQFAGRTGEDLPDEVFPNNWLSLHADGTAVLYPLLAPNRRRERRLDVLDALQGPLGYRIERTVDLSHLETRGEYLEGTGSLVLDRMNHIAYACLSPRTHAAALTLFGRTLDYEIMAFNAVDRAARAIYHTNVLLSAFIVSSVLSMPILAFVNISGKSVRLFRKWPIAIKRLRFSWSAAEDLLLERGWRCQLLLS